MALRGSQRWLQLVMNRCPDVIDEAIARAIGFERGETTEWLSPLESEFSVFQSTQKGTVLLGGRFGCNWSEVGNNGLLKLRTCQLYRLEGQACRSTKVFKPSKTVCHVLLTIS